MKNEPLNLTDYFPSDSPRVKHVEVHVYGGYGSRPEDVFSNVQVHRIHNKQEMIVAYVIVQEDGKRIEYPVNTVVKLVSY